MDFDAKARAFLTGIGFRPLVDESHFEAAVKDTVALLEEVHEDGRDYEKEGRGTYEYAVREALHKTGGA